MSDSSQHFGAKLDLVLKLLNISRGGLAAQARVDKSLVSRWARGLTDPRGHNLTVVTDIVKARLPHFTQLSWDLPMAQFAKAVGAPGEAEALPESPAPRGPPGWLQASHAQSQVEVAREGRSYPGLYVCFRQFFRNSGEILGELMAIWREGDRLFFRQWDPSFSHAGEVFILRHQLFFVGEDDRRIDGLTYYLMNGISGDKAIRIDGLCMTVLNDRNRTPTAAVIVMQRLLDLENGALPNEAARARIAANLNALLASGELAGLIDPEVQAAVTPMVGVRRDDGSIDHVLRASAERSVAASEIECSARAEASIRRLRARLLGPADDLPLSLRLTPALATQQA